MSVDFLRRLPLFSGLSDEELNRLLQQSKEISLKPGDVFIHEGSPPDALYLSLEGEFEIVKRSDQKDVVLAVRGAGEVFGELSILSQKPRTASVRALEKSRLLEISKTAFMELMSRPTAALAMLHTVTERLNNTEAMLRQNEKMAALGTLSAGLAHELNNPAAAAKRSASQLQETLTDWINLAKERDAAGLDAHQVEIVNGLREEIIKRAQSPVTLDPLTRSDRESELQDWLEENKVDKGWEYAPMLVSFGWDKTALTKMCENFSSNQSCAVIPWLAVGCAVYSLLGEIANSAERLSEIVKAMKSYSYMDQAPVQEVDVQQGLENTLVILRHKLKEGISVIRDFAPNLPRIEAYGSELNQVWTNIIDNAIDAMKGKGELKIKTFPQDGQVVVEISDSGPGIPPDIQSRIFEPFFTTKAPGVGTGLGLHISHNIIAHKHRGQVRVMSQPGATTFQVTLPVRLKRQGS